MNRHSIALIRLWITACVLLGLCQRAHASPTRSFVLDSASVLAEGKLEGTTVESDGSISAGARTRRTELAGVPSAKSLLVLPDGSAYVGTGNDGKIYVYRDGVAKVFADTKQVMVSSLARDAAGTLYAGTLPKGKIFAIDAKGQLKEFSSPEGAEHVWALVFDEKAKTLFAATGPTGKIFAIDAKGKAEVYYDSEDAHIMALARAPDGSFYAGTSDRALLLHVRGVGRAEVLNDFDGSEVTGIALRGSQLAVIVNQFPKSLTPPKPLLQPVAASGPGDNHSTAPAQTPAPVPPPAQAGKGQLYRVSTSGVVERLFTAEEGHLTSVEWASDDAIYVGTGKEGHIHRVRCSDHDHALLLDVDERQILALQLTAAKPVFVTGDSAAIYEREAGPGQTLDWTSKVLDAGAQARFGQLTVRARGAVQLAARSGNTEKTDSTWSDWAPLSAAGAIASPPARFLQLRVRLGSATSVVYALEAFYLAQNQPALVTEISIEPPRPRSDSRARSAAASSVYKLRWKSDNPDNDNLRYRLYVKHEEGGRYRALLRESDVLTGTEHSWDTDAVPDGYYRVRVEASDELENPEPLVQRMRLESEPFLVDNSPPVITALQVQAGKITGTARDEQGPISKLEYSVDGLEWRLVRADDELLDSREEAFALPLLQLPKGNHLVAIRASDARGNTSTREIEVEVR